MREYDTCVPMIQELVCDVCFSGSEEDFSCFFVHHGWEGMKGGMDR